jgi:hypothetical protein
VTQCADEYKQENCGPCNDPLISNSEIAEKENAWLAHFKAGALLMRQTTLLWLLHIAFYKRAKDTQGGEAFRRDHASRARAVPQEGRRIRSTMSPADAREALSVAAERLTARTQAHAQSAAPAGSRQCR